MTKQRYPSEKLDQYMLRLPDGMRDRIKAAAAENNRSMNAEVVTALEEWLDRSDHFRSLQSDPGELTKGAEAQATVNFIRTPADIEAVVEQVTRESAARLRKALQSMIRPSDDA